MIRTTVALSLIAVIPLSGQSSGVRSDSTWSRDDARIAAELYNTPAAWDSTTLAGDVARMEGRALGLFPLNLTPHPIADLGTPGLGIGGLPAEFGLRVADQTLTTAWGSIGRDEFTSGAFDEAGAQAGDTDVFAFSIWVAAIEEGAEGQMVASSRSRPHFLWMGSKNPDTPSAVEWVAFQTAAGDSYLVINGHLFDLRVGRAVWVAPMEDGSIRYFQDLDVGFMTEAALLQYLEQLPSRGDALEFFGAAGVLR